MIPLITYFLLLKCTKPKSWGKTVYFSFDMRYLLNTVYLWIQISNLDQEESL